MIHAYSELYLEDAKDRLAQFFDYGINTCQTDPQWLTALFVTTGYANQFERGNPSVLAGMSGIELTEAVFAKAYGGGKELPPCPVPQAFTPEYWAGWALAEYQWFFGRRFKDIFELMPLPEIIRMYSVYHEMDISHFVDEMERRISKAALSRDTKLKLIRECCGLSQSELARAAGVRPHAIRDYEQRVKAIDRARSSTVYKLSRILCCDVEDLLENPMA